MSILWPQCKAKIEEGACSSADATLLYRPRDQFGALLNMHNGYSFKLGEHLIKSSEHLYQALRYQGNPDGQQSILEIKMPFDAKRLAYEYADKEYWPEGDLKLEVMQFCLFLKFFSNQEKLLPLMDQAREGGRPLVELSRKDSFWGMCLPLDGDVAPGPDAYGRLASGKYPEQVKTLYGCNALGKSLDVISELPRPLRLDSLLEWPVRVLSLKLCGKSLREHLDCN